MTDRINDSAQQDATRVARESELYWWTEARKANEALTVSRREGNRFRLGALLFAGLFVVSMFMGNLTAVDLNETRERASSIQALLDDADRQLQECRRPHDEWIRKVRP
jgi:hypothetical protein